MPDTEFRLPKEIQEQSDLAEQLHATMYPPAAEEAIPAKEEEQEQQPEEEVVVQPAENFEEKYRHLQGKYNKEVPRLSQDIRELKEALATLQKPQTPQEADTATDEYNTIIENLRKEYPDELVDNIVRLNSLTAEKVAKQYVQPVADKIKASEATVQESRSTKFVEHVATTAPNWDKIWQVSSELSEGLEPSDPKIAEFLMSPDPSGLYTNDQLLDMYNNNFDADRFAKLCNLYKEPVVAKPVVMQPNPGKEALLAPSRTPNQPVLPNAGDLKIWTMEEFNQFQIDDRNGKYDEASSAALWADATRAPFEGRFK